MARNQRTYDNEYKAQAVKLAQEIGGDTYGRIRMYQALQLKQSEGI